ncbi:MAG: hypothetical protein PF693_09180 [Spirochaetia bacterium]|nr:hypothetical protein [Spirochaetia bacterium]
MNCHSRHSFRLYYKRICSLASKWIIFFSTIFPEIIEKEVPVDIRGKWKQFKGILKALTAKTVEGFSDSAGLHRSFEYAHNTLFHKNMGLGP